MADLIGSSLCQTLVAWPKWVKGFLGSETTLSKYKFRFNCTFCKMWIWSMATKRMEYVCSAEFLVVSNSLELVGTASIVWHPVQRLLQLHAYSAGI